MYLTSSIPDWIPIDEDFRNKGLKIKYKIRGHVPVNVLVPFKKLKSTVLICFNRTNKNLLVYEKPYVFVTH
jgi:hypothetical protein